MYTSSTMKYLLLFVATCHGLAIQKQKDALPRPDLLVLTALDPPALQVEWGPVQSADPKDPVIGYKVKVWELPPTKTYKYIMENGEKKFVEEITQPEIGDAITPPEEDAKEIVVEDPLASKARIPDIKLGVIYEVRVRAFSRRRDGPLSAHMRVQLMDDKEEGHDNEIYQFV